MLVPGTFLGALSSIMRKKKKEKSLYRSDARGTRHKTFMSVVARRCPLMFIKPRGEGLWGFTATANTLQTHHSVIFFFFLQYLIFHLYTALSIHCEVSQNTKYFLIELNVIRTIFSVAEYEIYTG